MKARLFDQFGLVVHCVEDVGKPPPPTWWWVDHEQFKELLIAQAFATGPEREADIPFSAFERRFELVGVEVDGRGTWARYTESVPSRSENQR